MKRYRTGILNRFIRDAGGAFQVEFAIVFPVLLVLSLGLLEFSLLAFNYQRAAEATRRAVRLAVIDGSVPNTAALIDGAVIICTSSGGTVTCTGGSPALDPDPSDAYPDDAAARFQRLLATMQEIYPPILETNVRITYASTDVGAAEDAGGILPLITVEIFDLTHEFATGKMVGVPNISLPDFKTSVLGSGRVVNAV